MYQYSKQILTISQQVQSYMTMLQKSMFWEKRLLIHGELLVLQDLSIFKEKKLYWQKYVYISVKTLLCSNDVFIKHSFDNHDGEVLEIRILYWRLITNINRKKVIW